jgi:hypothetical protein
VHGEGDDLLLRVEAVDDAGDAGVVDFDVEGGLDVGGRSGVRLAGLGLLHLGLHLLHLLWHVGEGLAHLGEGGDGVGVLEVVDVEDVLLVEVGDVGEVFADDGFLVAVDDGEGGGGGEHVLEGVAEEADLLEGVDERAAGDLGGGLIAGVGEGEGVDEEEGEDGGGFARIHDGSPEAWMKMTCRLAPEEVEEMWSGAHGAEVRVMCRR